MSSPVLFQALPPLSPEEYRDLEASILANGVMVPVLVDERGVVVDGHHRRKIAAEHGLACPSKTVAGLGDAAKRSLALELNVHRRHLSREQRRALLAESLRADPRLSDREHARRVGASDHTAASVRRDLEESAQIAHFSERVDPRSGAASQPAAKRPKAGDGPRPARPALTDVFTRCAGEADRIAARMAALARDDRFPRNREQIAARDLATLRRAHRLIGEAVQQLAGSGEAEKE